MNDTAVVNVPLAKRGSIDAQIDSLKKAQAKTNGAETIQADRRGVLHLCKGGIPRTFANRAQADKAAERTGGEAYQCPLSRLFHVRFAALAKAQGGAA